MPILPSLRRRAAERRDADHVGAAAGTPAPVPVAPEPWPRALLVLLGITLAFAVLLGLHQLRDYVAPVFLALNLVLAAVPLQRWLVKVGTPRPLAAVVTGTAIFAFLLGFFTALGWSAAAMVEELSSREYRQRYTELYNQVITFLEGYGLQQDTLTEQLESALDPSRIIGALGGVLSNLGGILGLLTTTVIVIFFLMIDTLSAGRRMALVKDQHPNVAHALVSFGQGVRRYWVVTTVFGLIVALLDVIALVWLGVPLALAWGVLSFLTNYIPNIGFVIGLVPPAVVALLANGPVNALLVVAVYSVLNFVVQSLIQPKFTGDAVGVTPTITFISLVVWAWVLGPVGALLALPATLLVKAILIDADPQARWVNAFLASNPETAQAETTRESFGQET
ncbi:AI-2E family transporter [Serinicoccus kebangsaanensis]|uniref:AI-2E family transporter n=1 Tax=Serinicoccus kebangsaanensis TaxID=2602069 RepID=UPI00124ECE9B|nr:AI-2E family transporter [Serinicoccus kebangsaanensis]